MTTMTKTETAHNTPATVEEGYVLVHNLIFDQVHKFRRQFGGDFDELVGEANLAFVRGHAQFVRGTTATGLVIEHSYATEIRRWVWWDMFDRMRTRLNRKYAAPMVSLEDQEFEDHNKGYRWAELVDELGPDARVVAALALDPPEAVEREYEAKGGQPRNLRSTVRSYLTDMGWRPDRISAAFAEIKRVVG